MYEYNELNRVEKPAIELFEQLRYTHVNAFYDQAGPHSVLGREHESEVVLLKYLRPKLAELNKQLLAQVAEQAEDLLNRAIEEIKRDRSDRPLAEANRDVYLLLKNGVELALAGEDKRDKGQSITLRYIDWEEPKNNDYLLVSQLWLRHDRMQNSIGDNPHSARRDARESPAHDGFDVVVAHAHRPGEDKADQPHPHADLIWFFRRLLFDHESIDEQCGLVRRRFH